MVSADFPCTSAVVVDDILLVDNELSFKSMLYNFCGEKIKLKHVL